MLSSVVDLVIIELQTEDDLLLLKDNLTKFDVPV